MWNQTTALCKAWIGKATRKLRDAKAKCNMALEQTQQDVQDLQKLQRKAEFDLKIVTLNLEEGLEINLEKQRRDLEKMKDKLTLDIQEIKELIKRANKKTEASVLS